MDNDNIVRFGALEGGKTDTKKDEFPSYPYVIVDIDGDEHYYDGYLIFTSAHVCIMEEGENGPVTGLMVPLHRVKLVTIDDSLDGELIN